MTISSRKSSRSTVSISDLPVEILHMIFERCHPVTCYRARSVCRRWRETIDEVDEEEKQIMVGDGHARLYVCDRRRAILETFPCLPSCCNTVRDLTSVRKSLFREDRYAHTTLSNWAYRFDLTEWNQKYDITEVWLQNFGSFLERDQNLFGDSSMVNSSTDSSVAVGQSKSGSFTGASLLHPSSTRYPGGCSQSQRSSGSSGSLGNSGTSPYNLLPSSQQASLEDIYKPSDLDEETCADLSQLSSGRFERLAAQLCAIQPLHIVFNDHSFYQKRPALLLFWFLKMLSNLRKLTLDGIQGEHFVELHRVLCVSGLDELVVIQPQQKACIGVNENLLDAFLEVPQAERRRFSLRFSGKTSLSAQGLCGFIKKWQNSREPVPFSSILVDAIGVRPADFVCACLKREDRNNNEAKKNEEVGINILNAKQLSFRHRRSDVRIKYRYEDGYLFFTYFDPKESPRKFPLPATAIPRVVSFYSPPPPSISDVDVMRSHSKIFRSLPRRTIVHEDRTLIGKLFNLVLRSSA